MIKIYLLRLQRNEEDISLGAALCSFLVGYAIFTVVQLFDTVSRCLLEARETHNLQFHYLAVLFSAYNTVINVQSMRGLTDYKTCHNKWQHIQYERTIPNTQVATTNYCILNIITTTDTVTAEPKLSTLHKESFWRMLCRHLASNPGIIKRCSLL